MLNIGSRPTLDNGSDVSVEAHLFDFDGNLYDEELTLSFISRLRPERRFSSEEELTHQLMKDQSSALAILNSELKA